MNEFNIWSLSPRTFVGSPLQNTLSDLWSLFDFIFPGRLATLPVFEEEFVAPIKLGGYTHASTAQVEGSIAVANALKTIIDPFILRRTKEIMKREKDCNFHIPNKTEQVLFCKLTESQLAAYKGVLGSGEMQKVLEHRGKPNSVRYGRFMDRYDREDQQRNRSQCRGYTFKVITMLKKICNHSDLLLIKSGMDSVSNEIQEARKPIDYGTMARSGKLQVLNVILPKWKEQGHKALLFCQTKQFLDIVERFVKSQGFVYDRLDGSTPVRKRGDMIQRYNEDDDRFLMLLTTRAGGLGINLTGADRVIVMDPDWNPSTDSQARERVYRIGQRRDVVVYRLIVRGTIEEKVYHRQIYKQFLTDKVLKDPNHQRVFSEKDLMDLFSLDDSVTLNASQKGVVHGVSDRKSGHRNHRNNRNEGNCRNSENEKLGETDQMFADLSATITSKQVENDENDNNDGNGGGVGNDGSDILKLLFSANGIASAFRHDAIEDLDEKERLKMEKAAKKVAKRALKALERSEREIQKHSVTKPTWTGSQGFNHEILDEKRKKFGNHRDLIHIIRSKLDCNGNEERKTAVQSGGPLSSSSLLAQIKARKGKVEADGTDSGKRKAIKDLREKRYEVLVRDLYQFVKAGGEDGIRSDRLIQQFDHRLLNEQEQYMFKIILQVCLNVIYRLLID